jgi:NitT/TauT family transport system substrate-binding protein
MPIVQSRRRFLTDVALTGAAGLGVAGVAGLGSDRKSLAAEPPPETTKLRLIEQPVTCFAPVWVAGKELLHDEGFTDVQYLTWGKDTQTYWAEKHLLSGAIDISLSFLPTALIEIDAGAPLVWLAGSHIGCIELYGSERVSSTRDLKGKTVPITSLRDPTHIFVSMFAAYVGLDPNKDINWLIDPKSSSIGAGPQLLANGSIDAVFVGPHEAAMFREKKIGHVLVNTTTDKPWSQYFCCMIASTKEFVRRNPVATKRAVRALLKATDLCASDPEGVARLLIERNVPQFYDWHYDKVLQEVKDIPYGQWREFDPEDSVRFHALRMREVEMIQTSPQKIIDEHTDWRFFNELKHELKM